MDWLDPTDGLRVVLAVIRLPAADRKNYGGPIFFNPGVGFAVHTSFRTISVLGICILNNFAGTRRIRYLVHERPRP